MEVTVKNQECFNNSINKIKHLYGNSITLTVFSVDNQVFDVSYVLNNNVVYIGKIDYTNDPPLYFSHDSSNLVSQYDKGSSVDCDACHTIRNRSKYYVFSLNGKILHIGSTCVKKYVGFDIGIVDSLISGIKEEQESIHTSSVINTNTLIGSLALQHKNFAKPYCKETTYLEFDKFVGKNKGYDASSKLDQIYDYWKNKDTEFAHNVKSVLFDFAKSSIKNYIDLKFIKIAMCGICFALTDEVSSNNLSQFVGTVGKREVFNITINTIRIFDSAYGEIAYINCEDSSKNAILIKTNLSTTFYARAFRNKGNTIEVKATVGKQEIKRGTKTTVLQRCK